ncbi:TetR/AcrR family transcriptional regulator [Micromonospora sp. 067-2]|uniref:TetR/AcrR family transcriptional regulator n=1 Tax=Micromonospora sp. 067-2 TaxID=2789270 RepID=UPI00397B3810
MTGIRERKKTRTRHALHQAALRLFAEQGYLATTIAEIAAAADVSPRTFFTYFDTKEALLFEHLEPLFVRLEQRLATRPTGGTALQETRAWLVDDLLAAPIDEDADRLLDQLSEEIPAVAAHGTAVMARIEIILAAALATDLGSSAQDPTPHMVASAAVAALYRSAMTGDHFHPDTRNPEHTIAHFDRALRFIEHGLDGLRRDDDTPR